MGGIGKTQLAVEYVYRYRDDYPDGIFWINAAEPLAVGMAQISIRSATRRTSHPPPTRAAYEELRKCPASLLVFDNLEDPSHLLRPVVAEPIPLTLPCRILFTTRTLDLGRFRPIEVTGLPEEPALRLFSAMTPPATRTGRRPFGSAAAGLLAAALELAGAFLATWPDVPRGLPPSTRRRGMHLDLDFERGDLSAANFQPTHAAAVAATLKSQWDALSRGAGDEAARLILRIAGQFPRPPRSPLPSWVCSPTTESGHFPANRRP